MTMSKARFVLVEFQLEDRATAAAKLPGPHFSLSVPDNEDDPRIPHQSLAF
jgi:hypothetical protein